MFTDEHFSDMDENRQHEYDEELPEISNARNQVSNQRKQGEINKEEEFLATFSEMQNFKRFSITGISSSSESANGSKDAENDDDQGENGKDDDDTDTVRELSSQ